MPVSGPTVTRRQLGRWLRELRNAAGKTERDIEEANLASRAKLWRIETGRVSVKLADVRALCWLYGADNRTTGALSDVALGTNGQGWWENYEVMPVRNGMYLGLEAIAESISAYDAERIPELLQTPDYIRALHPDADDSAVRQRVAFRLERQKALTARTPPLRLTVVLGENVLARRVGGSPVMAEQVRWLKELAQQQASIDIRIIPWRAGAHPAMHSGPFNILDFASGDDPTVVHFEAHTGAHYLERRTELAEYRRLFAHIYRQAVPIGDCQATQSGPTRTIHPGRPARVGDAAQ
jgi:transcriptional regulator with XRE-family HTH domain